MTKRQIDAIKNAYRKQREAIDNGSSYEEYMNRANTSDPEYEEFSRRMLNTPSSARASRLELSRQARENLSDGITPLWKRQAAAPASFTEELRRMYGRPSGIDYGRNPYNAEFKRYNKNGAEIKPKYIPEATIRAAEHPTATGEPRKAGFKDVTLNSITRGYLQSRYGQESYKEMLGKSNQKEKYRSILAGEEYNFQPDNWYTKAISGAGELLGQQYRQMTDPRSIGMGAGAAGAAAVAGQMGPQVLVPEEVATVPAAFAAGMTAGSTLSNYEIETGLAYNEMVENGISKDTAKNVAIGVGGVNSLLEMVQLDDLVKSFKILDASDATKPLAKKVMSYIGKRGGNVASETAQEVMQEGSAILGAQLASKHDTGDWAYSTGEVGQRLGDTAASSALSFGVIGAGGDAAKAGTNRLAKSAAKTPSIVKNEIPNTNKKMQEAITAQQTTDALSAVSNTQGASADTNVQNSFAPQEITDINSDAQQNNVKTAISKYGEATGRRIEWYTDKSMPEKADANGFYKNGTIYINENAENPQLEVFKHELFHSLDGNDKRAVIDFFKSNVNENTEAFRKYKNETMQAYRRKDLKYSEADFWEEYTAQNAEFLLDEGKIEQIAKQDRNLAQRMLDAIKAMLKRVRDVFAKPRDYSTKVSSHESGLVSGLSDAQLQKAEQLYEKALQNTAANNVRAGFSIKQLPDGKKYVQADRKVITGNDPKVWAKQVEDYINSSIRGGENVIVYGADGDPLTITSDTAGKAKFRNYVTFADGNKRRMTDAEYLTKLRAESHIDELSKVSNRGRKTVPDTKNHPFAKDGFNYRTAYFMDKDNAYYKMTMSVGKNGEVNTVYNVGKIKEADIPQVAQRPDINNAGGLASSDDTSITQKETAVNPSIRERGSNDTRSSLKRSKFYDSLQEANTVNEEVKRGAKESEDAFYYQQISNEETMKKAVSEVEANPDKEAAHFLGLDDKEAKTEDIAKGFVLLKQYQDSGDYESAIEVAKKLSTVSTEKGRQVQIYSVLGRLTPEGMLKYATGELEKAKRVIAKSKWDKKWLEGAGKKIDLTPEEAKWITDTMERVQNMSDGRDKAVMIAEIQKKIQSKLPSTPGSKLATLQRISLLLNPKTVISRNALSNVMMNPFFTISDFVASGLDKAVGNKTGLRTTGLPSYRQQLKGMKKGLYESFDDFRRGINTRDVQAGRYDITNSFGSGPAFKGERNPIAFLDRLTGYLLDTGDRPFFEGYFLESLNGQMKANKVSEPTANMIDIATQTALEKTWQDTNIVTKSADMIRRGLNLGHDFGLGSIIVPFTKTPSNLAKAIVEFSPVGFAKGLTVDAYKTAKAIHNGTITPQQQRKFVDNVAKGITGVMMYVAGLALAGAGLTVGSDDEKDKDIRNFKRNILGISQNAIRIGDRTFQFDWAQPIGSILTITADIKKNNIDMSNAADIITNALAAGGNTLFEQSMLRGLSDFFGSYDGFVTSLVRSVIEFPTQLQPTLLKQVAEVVDPVARTTAGAGLFDTAGRKMLARAPQATKRLEPVVDVLGRDVLRYGGKNSLFNIFLNPANVNVANPTEETKEIWRLYEQTGDKDVFPKAAPSSFSYKGTSYKLTPQEKTQFQRTMGKQTGDELKRLMGSTEYVNPKTSEAFKKSKAEDKKSMTDESIRADLVKKTIDAAYESAKEEILKGRGIEIEKKEAKK